MEGWLSTPENSEAERFKWVWNETKAELVWMVSGPGDGRPYHEEQVAQEWGRRSSQAAGDVFGIATHAPSAGAEPARVSIHAYFDAGIPTSIVGWFKEAFPNAEVCEPPRS